MINTNCTVAYQGKKIHLCLAYDIVLKIYELLDEKELDKDFIGDTALYLLVRNQRAIRKLAPPQRLELLSLIIDEVLATDKRSSTAKGEKIVDFLHDEVYIYSSFMADYGIDLIEQKGKLDWRKYISLFQGLSENTKIRQIMAIRARKEPTATKDNLEEVMAIREAKEFYSLDTPDEYAQDKKPESFSDGVGRLMSIFEAQSQR